MDHRMLTFDSDVSAQSVSELLAQLNKPNSPRRVLIDSPGGKFGFFSVLGPAVRRCGITTLAGDVASSAVVLYLLGHHRQATPDSTFFFHEVYVTLGHYGEVNVTDMESYLTLYTEMEERGSEVMEAFLAELQAAQRWMVSFMAELSGVPAGTYLNLMRNDVTLTAQEAKQYNIVHEIVSGLY